MSKQHSYLLVFMIAACCLGLFLATYPFGFIGGVALGGLLVYLWAKSKHDKLLNTIEYLSFRLQQSYAERVFERLRQQQEQAKQQSDASQSADWWKERGRWHGRN